MFLFIKKRILTGGLFLLILLFTSYFPLNTCTISTQSTTSEGYIDITVSEAFSLIENTSNIFILDVRTEGEYLAGHINNSHLIPYNEIKSNQDELPQNKSLPLIVYCRSGRRSAIASSTLVELKYTQVYNMLGGFTAWMDAKYPYESSGADSSQDIIGIIAIAVITSLFLISSIIIVTRVISRKIG